ncbi:MAG: hypothetical protein JWO11_304 [Nocardioides sp.]|nr:hypothetical protein [Nocardioides sp.]
MTRSPRLRTARSASLLLVLSVALSSCGLFDIGAGKDSPSATQSPSASATPYNSQFTRDGTFQSHIDVDGVDFVYTLYPTKSTPRTNEWYPRGNHFFSFTFQAYDLDRRLRDPFSTKRKVYLANIRVTSGTKTANGKGGQSPYRLNADAKQVTFDPEPLTTRYGMIITSPKGAFELRNQKIRGMSLETIGVDLSFSATVWIQRTAGGTGFYRREIRQTVPIAIFASKKPTSVAPIPVDAN